MKAKTAEALETLTGWLLIVALFVVVVLFR